MSLVYENMPSREKKLKQIAKVENMLSNRSHKPVANQFKITMQNGLEVFQSYETIICIKDPTCNEGAVQSKPIYALETLFFKNKSSLVVSVT